MAVIALDPGTANLVCAWENEGKVKVSRLRNCFFEIPNDGFSRRMLSTLRVPEFEVNGKLYLAGNEAFDLAQTFGKELRRPMSSGVISSGEVEAIPMMTKMIERLLKEAGAAKGDKCSYSMPADPVNEPFDGTFHKSIIEGILRRNGIEPQAVTEAHAIVLAELADAQFTGIGISWGGGMVNVCLSGASKIRMLDGKDKTIKELAEAYAGKESEKFWVYSCKKDGSIVPGRAYHPRKTGTRKMVRVHLDNGEHIDCTPDHKIMTRDGAFVEAAKLSVGTSLMPLYEQKYEHAKSRNDNSYLKVFDNATQKWYYAHRLIHERSGGKIGGRGTVVHHLNYDGIDNRPENLQFMKYSDHQKLHNTLAKYAKDTLTGKTLEEIHGTEKAAEIIESKRKWAAENRDLMLKGTLKRAQRSKLVRTGKTFDEIFGSERSFDIRKKQSEAKAGKTRAEILGSSEAAEAANQKTRERGVGVFGKYKRTPEIRKKISEGLHAYYNHKVVKVEELEGLHDVYDLTVDEHHNFALSSGVFVHNCVAFRSVPVITFSSVRAGDWIDTMAAQACGTVKPRVTAVKESVDFNLAHAQPNREQAALISYYEAAIQYALENIKKRFVSGKDMPQFSEPVEIVCSGGTSSPKGFADVFKRVYDRMEFPIPVKKVRVADDPLYTVVRGCLVSGSI